MDILIVFLLLASVFLVWLWRALSPADAYEIAEWDLTSYTSEDDGSYIARIAVDGIPFVARGDRDKVFFWEEEEERWIAGTEDDLDRMLELLVTAEWGDPE